MDGLAGRNVALNGIEKADELLVSVTLRILPEHLAVMILSATNRVVIRLRL